MWFMNKIINPFIILILRSPLRGIMGAGFLLISYTGRKSGKRFTLPVNYAREGSSILILPGMPE